MATAMDVANYFLAVDTECTMTHLKLEKMCSYAQAISLAYLGRPIFNEHIEAWTHGPVVPTLYQHFKKFGDKTIDARYSLETVLPHFDQHETLVLSAVNRFYGVYEAWALRNKSHYDFPGDFNSSEYIPHSAIKQAFENNPVVRMLRNSDLCKTDGLGDTLSESELLDALGC